jgi:hypothetical protein
MTLMHKKPCNVFSIPPLTSAQGHRAEDWRGKQIWTGNCRVTMNGKDVCLIEFVNEDGSIFATSSISDGQFDHYVSRCTDSSRFFALLLINPQTQQRANIGVQFPERNDSFDFMQAMESYAKYYRIDKGTDSETNTFKAITTQDFSIKQGEKITLNIKGLGGQGQTTSNKPKLGGLKKLGAPKAPPSKKVESSDFF